jgi:uncharacterized membrane protein
MTVVAAESHEAPITRRLARSSIWPIVVSLASGVYAIALSAESIYRHTRYATGFDTAISDQLLWLLAHWHDPFSTIVDRPMFGNHFEPGLALLTPLYWVGGGVPSLLIAQSLGLALTAPALYALARNRGAVPALAALPALLWLASPWTASANLFEFHPDTFVPGLLVLSVLASFRENWILLGLTAVLAMSFKEDVPLIYVVLGILLALSGRRRPGAILAVGSAVWLIVATRILESQGNSYTFFERRFAGNRGDTLGEAVAWMFHHPVHTATEVLDQSGPGVLLLLLATAGLAVLAPRWLLLSLPTLLHNALSAYPSQHSLSLHYHLITATGLFIAAAIGVRRVAAPSRSGRLALVGITGVAVGAALLGGVMVRGGWRLDPFRDRAAIGRALAVIPQDASVAAAPHLEPHLSDRLRLYTLPEPFIPLDWGSSLTPSEVGAKANAVGYVAFVAGDGPSEYPRDIATVLPLVRRAGFVQIYRDGPIIVFRRRG